MELVSFLENFQILLHFLEVAKREVGNESREHPIKIAKSPLRLWNLSDEFFEGLHRDGAFTAGISEVLGIALTVPHNHFKSVTKIKIILGC